MIATGPQKGGSTNTALRVVAIVTSVLALLFGVFAVVLYSDLSQTSPCDGGLGVSPCPASVGFGLEEWDHAVLANGSYTYSFVLFPVGSYHLNTSSLWISFATSSGGNVSPASVVMYSAQGVGLVAYYHFGTWWIAAQGLVINLPSALRLGSTTALAGDNMEISDSSAHSSIGIGIT